eukprot:5311606-Pyramimonas_sp.AAC.2
MADAVQCTTYAHPELHSITGEFGIPLPRLFASGFDDPVLRQHSVAYIDTRWLTSTLCDLRQQSWCVPGHAGGERVLPVQASGAFGGEAQEARPAAGVHPAPAVHQAHPQHGGEGAQAAAEAAVAAM